MTDLQLGHVAGLLTLWRRHQSSALPIDRLALANLSLNPLQHPPRQPPVPVLQLDPHIRRNILQLCTEHPIQRIRTQQLTAQRQI